MSLILDLPAESQRWAAGSSDTSDALAGPLMELLAALDRALAATLAEPVCVEARRRFEWARRELALALAEWPKRERAHPVWVQMRGAISRLSASGAQDFPPAPADAVVLASLRLNEWTGLAALMVLMPAWRCERAPRLSQVPDVWWGSYTEWLLSPPQGFSLTGDAERYAQHVLVHLQELSGWVHKNSGSVAVRSAADAYLRVSNVIQLYFSKGDLREHAELRAGILRRLLAERDGGLDVFALPREGRRLRIGFVNRHFGSQTETYTTIPSFEQLDPERFEVTLFTCRQDQSVLEQYCRSKVTGFELLPADLAGQLAVLRAAALDVVVFGTNVTAVTHEITRLALHRVAPLQVVNNSSCITAGMPTVDLYVSGELTETANAGAHFTERLGLLPGPTHAFNYEADRQQPVQVWSKTALGIPEDAFLFVSAANYYKVIPEMREAWARLLAAVPGSRLLLHPFNPNWSSDYPIKRFCAEFEAVLTRYGVDHNRLVVSSMKLPSRADVSALMGVGDLYLDTAPFGGVNSLVDPLEAGVPVVVWEGETMRARMGSALLRTLGLEQLIATCEADYVRIVLELATDGERRSAVSAQIKRAMEKGPMFLDTLAASDVFGDLLESAFDEITERGAEAFRKDRTPVRSRRIAPLTRDQRWAHGNELLKQGRFTRAVTYLLAALQQDEGTATLWLDVAKALRANGQTNDAIQALEAGLRLDDKLVAGWEMMADLADQAGNFDLAEQARGLVRHFSGTAPVNPMMAVGARRSHVLLYTDDPEHGGVAQYNHTVLGGLVRAGYRVSCMQTQSGSPLVAEQAALGVTHHWLDYDTGKNFARTLTESASIRTLFAADRPDLVVFSDCSPVSSMAAREAARELGINYIVVIGFVAPYLAKNFAAYLPQLARQYSSARQVVAVAQENLDLLHQQFGLPAHQGMVIHYGRPDVYFRSADLATRSRLRAEIGVPVDAVVSLTTARLTGVKGFAHQLAAARRLAALPAARHLHFVWAGEGDERANLTREIAAAGLAGRIHLLGHRWDASDWYDAADIFTLPSHLEGMPLAIMEAMAKGLPVIATAVSGIPEELGDTGCLLPDPSVDAPAVVEGLVKTLAAWSSDAVVRQALGQRAQQRAEAMFKQELMLQRTLAQVSQHLHVG